MIRRVIGVCLLLGAGPGAVSAQLVLTGGTIYANPTSEAIANGVGASSRFHRLRSIQYKWRGAFAILPA
jgi:hypothetical protein